MQTHCYAPSKMNIPGTHPEKLLKKINLSSDEEAAINSSPGPPFKVTKHWLSLLDGTLDDPLRRQVIPTLQERITLPGELQDPLGEASHSPLPRLVHRYTNRAVVVATGRCALYCRHCFRRRLTGEDYGDISEKQADDIAQWLSGHREVKELLLSGGDPLTMDNRHLLRLIDNFKSVREDLVIRLATRMPIVDPSRITSSLARRLGRRFPLWVVLQVNHPRELAPEALKAISRLQKSGLSVVNQSVLLRGVNDNVDVLEELSNALVQAGVKPYYLFQGDMAAGTGHFRVPIEEGLRLSEELRSRVSGLGMPVYAVDLPGGGGKVPLGRSYILEHREDGWILKNPEGNTGFYREK